MRQTKIRKVLNLQAQANNEVDLLGQVNDETMVQLEIACDELTIEEQGIICRIHESNQVVNGDHRTNSYAKMVWEVFADNQNRNNHSENVVLLAKYYGTKSDLEAALAIQKKHNELGHIPYNLMQERDAIQSKLYPIMRAVKKLIQSDKRKNIQYNF